MLNGFERTAEMTKIYDLSIEYLLDENDID
jgi:hypothetical protein